MSHEAGLSSLAFPAFYVTLTACLINLDIINKKIKKLVPQLENNYSNCRHRDVQYLTNEGAIVNVSAKSLEAGADVCVC